MIIEITNPKDHDYKAKILVIGIQIYENYTKYNNIHYTIFDDGITGILSINEYSQNCKIIDPTIPSSWQIQHKDYGDGDFRIKILPKSWLDYDYGKMLWELDEDGDRAQCYPLFRQEVARMWYESGGPGVIKYPLWYDEKHSPMLRPEDIPSLQLDKEKAARMMLFDKIATSEQIARYTGLDLKTVQTIAATMHGNESF